MKIFSKLYTRMLGWAQHRHAPYYLAGVSFAESSFFPLPPDIMLAPMILARPASTWRFAGITALGSIMGGILGYLIGYLAYDAVGQHLIDFLGLTLQYERVVIAFEKWGIWIILLAGIVPIPYKLLTITAGVSSMPFMPFIAASAIGRTLRFFLVASLVKLVGVRLEEQIIKYIDYGAWAAISILLITFGLLKFG